MMADEMEAWNGSAYDASLLRGRRRIILIGFLVLFIELPLIVLGFWLVNPVLGAVGVSMLIATIYLAYRSKLFSRKASVCYVLTNKRALVVMGTPENQQILEQCDLDGATAVVQNYSVKSVLKPTRQSTISVGVNSGDVVFLKNGMKVLTFADVPDPNNVKATADYLIGAAGFSSHHGPHVGDDFSYDDEK